MRPLTLSPFAAVLLAFTVPLTTAALAAGFAMASAPAGPRVIEMLGRVAEAGGWTPGNVVVRAGEKIRFRLTSDDIAHGFAIGLSATKPVRVVPGHTAEIEVAFDQPGKYTFYCTEWCSMAHWRMRGVIEVLGAAGAPVTQADQPDYARLGIDIDAPHPAAVVPIQRPAAVRGAAWQDSVPARMLTREYYISRSPAQAWQDLRALRAFATVDDGTVWDVVAWVWQVNSFATASTTGGKLYAAHCASCHGPTGRGDGPTASMTSQFVNASAARQDAGHAGLPPTDFGGGRTMLGASTALLEGKIIRGGMGTGMPYWGPIFRDDEIRALADYLWRFQFDYQDIP